MTSTFVKLAVMAVGMSLAAAELGESGDPCAATVYRQALSLLFLDLDGLKNINDRHGHRAGSEAIRQMTARRPDVVVTDVSLPDFDGFELVSRLRRQEALASIPVIGLSGYGGYAHEQRARHQRFPGAALRFMGIYD